MVNLHGKQFVQRTKTIGFQESDRQERAEERQRETERQREIDKEEMG